MIRKIVKKTFVGKLYRRYYNQQIPEDDYTKIRELVQKEKRLFRAIPPARQPKKIVIYAMDVMWKLGTFEQLLHLAFQLKGHQPKTLVYDGLLPYSCLENLAQKRPDPETIEAVTRYHYSAFNIPTTGISGYLDEMQSLKHATEWVEKLSRDDYWEAAYRGIAIGKIAKRDLFQYTLGHFETKTEKDWEIYKKHLVHAVMSVDLAYAILAKEKPDIVLLVNGKSLLYSYMYEVARLNNIQTTTWEEGMYFDTSVVLANNLKAIDFPVEPEIWEEIKKYQFPEEELKKVEVYFDKWKKQEATSYKYYDNAIEDFEKICKELSIDRSKKIISAFPNIIWDTNALDRELAFESMMDWLYCTIDFVQKNQGHLLIIRAHPGEIRLRVNTRSKVKDLIIDKYGTIPENVKIIEPESEISSYEIARNSGYCTLYTGTLGIELALMGMKPIICGTPFYFNKGFSNDVYSKNDYFEILSGRKELVQPNQELLKKFMYIVLYKLVKQPEFFVGYNGHPQNPVVRINTFKNFPESMPVVNDIVESIVGNKSFISMENFTANETT